MLIFSASRKVKLLIDNRVTKRNNEKNWLQTKCPKCGGKAIREADTMDTFVDSSWYFLRFIDPKNKEKMFSVEKVKETFPVDLYIGGKEHGIIATFSSLIYFNIFQTKTFL